MKTMSNFNLKNKRVLLRTDLNCDVVNKKIVFSDRIKEAADTIKELKKKRAKVVIIAHQGRPDNSEFLSLKQHVKFLNKFTKVKFINDILGKKAINKIKSLKLGEALLLENIRYLKDEFKPGKNKIIKRLVPLFDIYINDAFSVIHRRHTSIISFPKYLPSCIGKNLEKELKALKKIKFGNCLYILGGAKPEDNIKLLKRNKVLACGLFGQLCLISKGVNFGAQNKFLKKELYLVNKLKRKLKNVELPVDVAVKVKGKRKELKIKEFPSKYEIYDIGSETIKRYVKIIRKAKVIYMKGPCGYFNNKQFARGTNAILRAVADNKGFSLLGGGHLSNAIKKARINKKRFNHISLSGGALLRYIAGEKLPGLEVLNKNV